MLLRAWVAAGLVLGAIVTTVSADEWVAVKLKGQVLQLVDNEWLPLRRGDVVSDDRVVRTMQSGRVEFRRDSEVIDLGPQTQIRIHDQAGQRFTTVTQYFGEVEVEAEVQNVQHFEVKTPFLASVVKGTKFVVHSGKDFSRVDVLRGQVAVESEVTHSKTLVSAGQSATASNKGELRVDGKGDLPTIVSANGVVVSDNGQSVASATDLAALVKQLKEAAKKAKGEEKEALEEAAKEAEEQAKLAEEAAKKAAEATKKGAETAQKAAKEAAEATEKAAKQAAETAEKAEKAAEEQAKDAKEAAEKATKAAEKAAKEDKKKSDGKK